MAAMSALIAAAGAQYLLEGARFLAFPPVALGLFAAAVGLALFAIRPEDPEAVGTRRLSIALPSLRWWLACLPGAACFVAATLLHRRAADAKVLALWLGGIALLLLVASVECWRRPREESIRARLVAQPQLWLFYLALIVVSLAMRMVYGVHNLPAFVYSDEIEMVLSAQNLGANWFDTFWVGMPNLQLVLIQIAEALFGWSLWGLRMGGVLAGTISVLATFAFGRRLIGDLPAFTGALLLAVAHTHVHWSRNAQPFIYPPLAAAVMLWLWVRAWTGGSLLAWVGAGIALGIGTPLYWSSHIFPLLLPITALGWMLSSDVDKRAALLGTLAVMVIGTLMFAPTALLMWERWSSTAVRPASLFLFNPVVLARFGDNLYAELWRHAKDTLLLFNFCTDFYPNYAARRSLVDPVTAAMVPLAAGLVLARLRRPIGWLCALWWAAFVVIGVFLTAHPPAYHRVPAALLFSSLAVAWTLHQLLSKAVNPWGGGWRAAVPAVGCLLFAAAAGIANAQFYFGEYARAQPISRELGLVRIMCRYAPTHAVINATVIDGVEHVPLVASLLRVDCADLEPVEFSNRSSDLWEVEKFTQAPKAVLIVPKAVVAAHPGVPRGYRVTRVFDDFRLTTPLPVPLTIFELERESAG